MESFAHLRSCFDLTEADVATAARDGATCRALLRRLADVSRPNDAGSKVLMVFARLASQACDWVDGELRIEIVGDAEMSVVEILSELGAGMRERVLPSFTLRVPLEEFVRTLDRTPDVVSPLRLVLKTPRRLVLAASEAVRRSSAPPSKVGIDSASLFGPPARESPCALRVASGERGERSSAGPVRPRLQRLGSSPDSEESPLSRRRANEITIPRMPAVRPRSSSDSGEDRADPREVPRPMVRPPPPPVLRRR